MKTSIGIGIWTAGWTLAALTANAAIPEGYYQGDFVSPNGQNTRAELFLKTAEDDQAYALYFSQQGDRTWGNVFSVEELNDGSLNFRRVFVDPNSPTLEAWETPWMVGTTGYDMVRGPRREYHITLSNGEATSSAPFTWTVRRPVEAAQREWLELDAANPISARGMAPFSGRADISFPNGNPFLQLQITSGPHGYIPYGIASPRLELRQLFSGVYTARLLRSDLSAAAGTSASQGLYGAVVAVTNRNAFRVWRELRVITFNQETADSGTTPGTVFSTTAVTFGE